MPFPVPETRLPAEQGGQPDKRRAREKTARAYDRTLS